MRMRGFDDRRQVIDFKLPLTPEYETLARHYGEGMLGMALSDLNWGNMWAFYKAHGNVPGGMQVHRWLLEAIRARRRAQDQKSEQA